PRPAVKAAGLRGARRTCRLGAQEVAGLAALGRAAGGDASVALLAAVQALLARYTGQRDVVIGWPVANRAGGEWSGVVGPFENTLVVRTDVGGDPTFEELVGRAAESVRAARAHGRVPLERLIAAVQPGGDVKHSPLFQVQLAVEEA